MQFIEAEMDKQHIAEKASEWASATTYGGGASAFIFGLSSHDIGVYGGLLIGILGVVVNAYFKNKAHKLELKKAGLKDSDIE